MRVVTPLVCACALVDTSKKVHAAISKGCGWWTGNKYINTSGLTCTYYSPFCNFGVFSDWYRMSILAKMAPEL